MKLSCLLFLGLVSIAFSITSANAGEEGAGLTDEEFDEEMFMKDTRKRLSDLTPEEAAEEVRELVAVMDADGDGFLVKEELIAYQIRLSEHNTNKQTKLVFIKNDEDGNGIVTFEETWVHSEGGEIPEESAMSEDQLRLKAKFITADRNGDGGLDEREFKALVYPTHQDHMIHHLVSDQLANYDRNNDGEISRREYLGSFNPEDLPEDELPEWVGDEKAKFDYTLDSDQNGRLDGQEIRQWLIPDEATLFDVEARHLFYNADRNKDRKLTVEEIEDRFDILIGSSITNNGFAVHEEL